MNGVVMFKIGDRCRILATDTVDSQWHNKIVVITNRHATHNPNLYMCAFFNEEACERTILAFYENEMELIDEN